MGNERDERARRRRREILAAYYQVLLDEGLEGASIGKVGRQLGVHPSLVIHYFGTKEQLTIELVDYLLEVYYETYGERLAAIEDPLERLNAILDTFFSLSYQQLLPESVFYGCFYLSLRRPKVRQAFAALHEAERALVEDAISACMASGALQKGDAHELALAVKGMEAGFAVLIGGSEREEDALAMAASLKRQVQRLLGLPPSAPAETPAGAETSCSHAALARNGPKARRRRVT
jgi:AcrR family transcriptional regulator